MEAFFKTLSHSPHNTTKTQGAMLGGPTKLQAAQADYFVLNKVNTLCGSFVASDVVFHFHKSLLEANFTGEDGGHYCLLFSQACDPYSMKTINNKLQTGYKTC